MVKNKRGQVTIFIILGILIVAAIGLVVYFQNKNVSIAPEEVDPKSYIQNCVENAIEPTLNVILKNGGEITPSLYILYNGEEINYLCYNGDFYSSCYSLHPGLEFEIENEIREDTKDEVGECFINLRKDYEAKGFLVDGGPTDYLVDILPGKVFVGLKKELTISKGDQRLSFSNFDTEVKTELYSLVRIARTIANAEATYCNFEYNGYMLLYPKFDIKRQDYRDSKLYRVIFRSTGEEFKFATRSCAFPPGI